MKSSRVLMAALMALVASAAEARLQDGWAERADAAQAPPRPPAGATITYGADPLQRLYLWPAPGRNPAPLVLFVHGGGWKRGSKDNAASRWLPTHLPQRGYAYAAIDYRLVPAVTVEQQGGDIARALKALLDRAPQLGIDRRRVVLMGHSAGAHLVAVVGTDERYLRSAGLSFADLAAVIANDGAAYDVPAQLQAGARMMQDTYAQVFGSDPARQRALSPTHHAAAPKAPAFLCCTYRGPTACGRRRRSAGLWRRRAPPSGSTAFRAAACAGTCKSTVGWATRTTPPPAWWMPGWTASSGASEA